MTHSKNTHSEHTHSEYTHSEHTRSENTRSENTRSGRNTRSEHTRSEASEHTRKRLPIFLIAAIALASCAGERRFSPVATMGRKMKGALGNFGNGLKMI